MKNSKTLELFLSRSCSQKEPVFIIAENNKAVKEYQAIIEEAGYKQAKTIKDLMKEPKTVNNKYIIIQEGEDLKDVYDFMVQYPTGQVEIYDKKNLTTDVLNPDYKNTSFLFLVTKDTLSASRERGYDLLSQAGLTYQV